MKSLDQSLLPLIHLHHHDSRDVWAPFCNTCRSVKQRRKAARCDSGANHHNIKYNLKPYGTELWLDTLYYKNDQVPVGQFHYDLASWDVGTGWTAFMPMKNVKADMVVATLRKHRRYDEELKKVVSDSANQTMQAARAQSADEAPLTPYRPQGNRLEREIETVGDSLKAQFEHSRCIPHINPGGGP